jgi:hypothetical protein
MSKGVRACNKLGVARKVVYEYCSLVPGATGAVSYAFSFKNNKGLVLVDCDRRGVICAKAANNKRICSPEKV